MQLLIADGPTERYERCGVYLGTDRNGPWYVEQVGPEARVNQLHDWYYARYLSEELLSEKDLEMARELVVEYAKLGIFYQLLELAPDAAALEQGRFIGYDVSFRGVGDSLLSWGLTLHRRPTDRPEILPRAITLLVERYFQPRLNESGLFDDRETAAFLLDVARAMNQVEPGCLETGLEEYHVVAVGVVADSTEAGERAG